MEVNARKSSPLPETGKRSDKYATIGITRGVSIRSNFRNDFRSELYTRVLQEYKCVYYTRFPPF